MATVYIPTLLQPAASGASRVEVPGATVRQIIANLEQLHPGIQAKLVDGDRLRPNISVAVDGEVAPLGLMEPVPPDGEVHFVTAISGGCGRLALWFLACSLAAAEMRPVIVEGAIISSSRGGNTWFYDNTALTMRSQACLHARAGIP